MSLISLQRTIRLVFPVLLCSFLLLSCNTGTIPAASSEASTRQASNSPVPTVETATPTATLAPMALTVNGQGVTLAEYNVQKQQLLSAADTTGKTIGDEEIGELLNTYFIEVELLAQAAYKAGYNPSDTELAEKLQALKEKVGGEEAFQNWLTVTGTSEEFFLLSFRRELAAQWQRDRITEEVGETAEQIHARQILVDSADEADQIYHQLQGGLDFTELAAQYDPVTKGDLGWFPRGYLFLSEIEEKVFALQPGQYTEVIHSDYGYHIVLVEEREEDHPLSEAARLQLTHLALNNWLLEQKAASTIEVLLP